MEVVIRPAQWLLPMPGTTSCVLAVAAWTAALSLFISDSKVVPGGQV
jgi:hypothetical protein